MKNFTGKLSRFNPATRFPDKPAIAGSLLMVTIMSLFALVMAAGCATTKVTDREQDMSGPLPRPGNIWVHDFAASQADLPDNSALADQNFGDASFQSPEHIAIGRQLGAEIGTELVKQIRAMGMPAEHAVAGTTPQLDDIVLQGYLISFAEGDASKRVLIGLGEGSSELKVAVEGFEMTSQGLQKIGSGQTDATGNKTPGMGVGLISMLATHNPAGLIISTGMKVYDEKSGKDKVQGRATQTAKEIADVLKKRFQQEGWID